MSVFLNPYLDGWHYKIFKDSILSIITINVLDKDSEIKIIRTTNIGQIKDLALKTLNCESLYQLPLTGTNISYITSGANFYITTDHKIYQALYELEFPQKTVPIHIFPKQECGGFTDLIRVTNITESELNQFQLFHPGWLNIGQGSQKEKTAYFVPLSQFTKVRSSKGSKYQDAMNSFIISDLNNDCRTAHFITTDNSGLYKIDEEDRQLIGSGSYGSIFCSSGIKQGSEDYIAVKYGSVRGENSVLSNLWQRITKECGNQIEIRGIIKPITTKIGSKEVLVTKLYQGDLTEVAFNESLANQIVEGLYWMTHFDVIHIDIKPGNIFADGQEAVIADFGLAYIVKADNFKESDKRLLAAYISNTLEMSLEFGDETLFNDLLLLGKNPQVHSPDVFKSKVMDLVFRLHVTEVGLSLYEWATRKSAYSAKPFKCNFPDRYYYENSKTPDFKKYLNNHREIALMRSRLSKKCSDQLSHLILRMIDPDPYNRLTFVELHKYLMEVI